MGGEGRGEGESGEGRGERELEGVRDISKRRPE